MQYKTIKLLSVIVIFLIFAAVIPAKPGYKTISFTSADGLEITADLYMPNQADAPFIILFHQASWSRGEYLEIAPKLNKMGFNCLALDQRSGNQVNGVVNQTAKLAQAKKLGVYYLDAYTDLQTALGYVKKHLAKGKIIIWGSSYSASLVFKLAAEFPESVNGLLAFAPGEYFKKAVGKENYISGFAAQVKCPVFITSAKSEAGQWAGIFQAVKTPKFSYLPQTNGNHGSRALWQKFPDHKGYWQAVVPFLNKFL